MGAGEIILCVLCVCLCVCGGGGGEGGAGLIVKKNCTLGPLTAIHK